MKLSELEKLAQWHQAMAKEPKRNQAKRDKHFQTATGITEVCATFREMLEAMRELPHSEYCNAIKGPDGYEWVEEDKCDCGRNVTIKQAEEML